MIQVYKRDFFIEILYNIQYKSLQLMLKSNLNLRIIPDLARILNIIKAAFLMKINFYIYFIYDSNAFLLKSNKFVSIQDSRFILRLLVFWLAYMPSLTKYFPVEAMPYTLLIEVLHVIDKLGWKFNFYKKFFNEKEASASFH